MWISWLCWLPCGHTGACPCTEETHMKVLAGRRASCFQFLRGGQHVSNWGIGVQATQASAYCFCGFYVNPKLFQKHQVLKPKSAKRVLNPPTWSQEPRFYAAGHRSAKFLGVAYNNVIVKSKMQQNAGWRRDEILTVITESKTFYPKGKLTRKPQGFFSLVTMVCDHHLYLVSKHTFHCK